MSVLKGKKVLLGISGGIAAYKSAFLVRLFIKAGAQVKVVMTPAAKEFVTPLTLSKVLKTERLLCPVCSVLITISQLSSWAAAKGIPATKRIRNSNLRI